MCAHARAPWLLPLGLASRGMGDILAFWVSYHGHFFAGWHKQAAAHATGNSAQAALEQAVERLLGATQPVVKLNVLTEVATAKGTHARGQMVFFRATPAAVESATGQVVAVDGASQPRGSLPPLVVGPLRRLAGGWPRPGQLRVCYYIQQGEATPALTPFCWHVREQLNLCALQAAVLQLVGDHDFRNLSKSIGGTVLQVKAARVVLLPAIPTVFQLNERARYAALPN